MNEVYRELLEIASSGGRSALATVIFKQGPTPMSAEAKMLIRPEGRIVGTVGGGCNENRVLTEGKKTLLDGLSRTLSFTLTEKEASEEGHICGGRVQIFVEPVTESATLCAQEILRLSDLGRPAAVATLISRTAPRDLGPHSKMLVRYDGTTVGSLGDPALEERVVAEGKRVMESEQPVLLPAAGAWPEVFIEAIPVTPTVYIFGAGHVSYFVAKLAKSCGFRVAVTDDRSQYANRERFPEVDEVIAEEFETVCEKLTVDRYSYLVIVTRGHQHDEEVLEWAAYTSARYIGMIGSKPKTRITFLRLQERGVPKELLKRVHAPIGLDISAVTPEEIAIAIVGELIMVRRAKAAEEESTREIRVKKVVPVEGKAQWK